MYSPIILILVLLFFLLICFFFLFQSDDERETEQGRKDQRKYQSPPHGIETTYASTSVSTALQYETIVSLTSERRRQQRPFLFDAVFIINRKPSENHVKKKVLFVM
tara:strand:- start:172 stop:489 length:318 start_codon:yes stop_codon:yes gene_type:complete